MVIYAGEIKDNTGRVVVAKDEKLTRTDPRLEKMDWLVEGTVGKIE